MGTHPAWKQTEMGTPVIVAAYTPRNETMSQLGVPDGWQ